MTDKLKALKTDADQKKVIAENLRAKTRAAYAAAARAQAAYSTEEKRLKAKGEIIYADHTTTAKKSPPGQSDPLATPADHHREQIAQSEVTITNLEYELSEERDRLFTYKQNLHECQNGEDLSSIVERDRRAEYWLEQLQTKYRHYCDSEIAGILNKAGFSSIELCYLATDMAKIIKNENRRNIEAILKLVDCNGFVTVPGFDHERASILQRIWSRPFDTCSRTAKPTDIRDMTDRFALELSYQKTLGILRHCATVEHIRRSTKHESDEQKERNRRIIDEWNNHTEFHKPRMMDAFCRHIEMLGLEGASKSTIIRIIKNTK